jgi:large subunit ribosomal protein L22
MHAYLRSVRIAPKKANLVARMIRGLPVPQALISLEHTHKKAARILEGLLKSAMANASHNDRQDPQTLVIKSLIVNQATALRRGMPRARGSVRPIRKFLSHIEIQLGYPEEGTVGKEGKESKKVASQGDKFGVHKKKSAKTSADTRRSQVAKSSGPSISPA